MSDEMYLSYVQTAVLVLAQLSPATQPPPSSTSAFNNSQTPQATGAPNQASSSFQIGDSNNSSSAFQATSSQPAASQLNLSPPGTGQTGQASPTTASPDQPGAGQFGSGRFGTGQFGAGQFGAGQFGAGHTNTGQTSPGKFGVGQFGAGQFGTNQLSPNQPGTDQPSAAQPSAAQSAGQPNPNPSSTGRIAAGLNSQTVSGQSSALPQDARQLSAPLLQSQGAPPNSVQVNPSSPTTVLPNTFQQNALPQSGFQRAVPSYGTVRQPGRAFQVPMRTSNSQQNSRQVAPATLMQNGGLRTEVSDPGTTIQSSELSVTAPTEIPQETSVVTPPTVTGQFGQPTPASSSPIQLDVTEETTSITDERSPSASPTEPVSRSFVGLSNGVSAKSVLSHALVEPEVHNLNGKVLTLLDALERVTSRTQRLQVIKGYWRLSLGVADYYNSLDEVGFLSTLSDPHSVHEQAALRAAVAAARARERETILAAVAAQHDLADAASLSASERPPLSSDAPFAGKYLTRFDTLFADRAAPSGLRRLDASLPYYLALAEARAESVITAEEALQELARAYSVDSVPVATVIAASHRLRDQRIAFLAAVRDYNEAIAEYALNAARSGLRAEQVVSMLIQSRAVSTAAASSNSRPVNHTEPILQPAQNEPPLLPIAAATDAEPVAPEEAPIGFRDVTPRGGTLTLPAPPTSN